MSLILLNIKFLASSMHLLKHVIKCTYCNMKNGMLPNEIKPTANLNDSTLLALNVMKITCNRATFEW